MTTPKAKLAGLALIAALVVAAIISVPASVQSGSGPLQRGHGGIVHRIFVIGNVCASVIGRQHH